MPNVWLGGAQSIFGKVARAHMVHGMGTTVVRVVQSGHFSNICMERKLRNNLVIQGEMLVIFKATRGYGSTIGARSIMWAGGWQALQICPKVKEMPKM